MISIFNTYTLSADKLNNEEFVSKLEGDFSTLTSNEVETKIEENSNNSLNEITDSILPKDAEHAEDAKNAIRDDKTIEISENINEDKTNPETNEVDLIKVDKYMDLDLQLNINDRIYLQAQKEIKFTLVAYADLIVNAALTNTLYLSKDITIDTSDFSKDTFTLKLEDMPQFLLQKNEQGEVLARSYVKYDVKPIEDSKLSYDIYGDYNYDLTDEVYNISVYPNFNDDELKTVGFSVWDYQLNQQQFIEDTVLLDVYNKDELLRTYTVSLSNEKGYIEPVTFYAPKDSILSYKLRNIPDNLSPKYSEKLYSYGDQFTLYRKLKKERCSIVAEFFGSDEKSRPKKIKGRVNVIKESDLYKDSFIGLQEEIEFELSEHNNWKFTFDTYPEAGIHSYLEDIEGGNYFPLENYISGNKSNIFFSLYNRDEYFKVPEVFFVSMPNGEEWFEKLTTELNDVYIEVIRSDVGVVDKIYNYFSTKANNFFDSNPPRVFNKFDPSGKRYSYSLKLPKVPRFHWSDYEKDEYISEILRLILNNWDDDKEQWINSENTNKVQENDRVPATGENAHYFIVTSLLLVSISLLKIRKNLITNKDNSN